MLTKFIKNRFTDTPLKDNNNVSTANNTYSKNKSNGGFTLMEVAVSILLIAFFLAIFGPPIADIFKEIINSSDNDQSFNNAYNLTTYYASTGSEIADTDKANISSADAATGDVTISLFKQDGTLVTGTSFKIPAVKYYFSNYDTGSFGNAKQLCFNDYYVKPN